MAASPTAPPEIFMQDAEQGATLAGSSSPWKFLARRGKVYAVFTLLNAVVRMGDNIADVSGTAVTVAVRLASLPGKVPGSARAAFTVAGDPETVEEIEVQPSSRLELAVEALLRLLLQSFITQHAGQLSFDVLQLTPPAGVTDTWLQPSSVQFALGADEGADRTALLVCGALNGTGPAAPPNGAMQIPAGWNGLYLLSSPLVMRHLVAPALASAYGLPPNAFVSMAPNVLFWGGSLDLPGQKVGAITYYPKIESIMANLAAGGMLFSQANGSCDLGAGIHLHFTVRTRNPFQFNAATQSMTFLHDPNPPETTHSDVPTWLSVLSAGLADSIVSLIAITLGQRLSSFAGQNIALTNIPAFVQWSGLPHAVIRAASLDGSLLLEGSF
jgi:hypothetical protein